MKNNFICGISILLLMAGCNQPGDSGKGAVKPDMIAADRDTTVRPNDDFFSYANGGWINTHKIPADETSYGISEMVENELRQKLLTINTEAMAKGAKDGPYQQIGDFWFSAMDTLSIEKNGISPLAAEIKKVDFVKSKDQLVGLVAHLHKYDVNVFFDGTVTQDPKHSDVEAYFMSQGGLGLPDRDFYFNSDARTQKVRSLYPAYIATIFRLQGNEGADAIAAKAAKIVSFETQLAKVSRKLEDRRDADKNYNKYALSQLAAQCPGFNLPEFLNLSGINHLDSVIIGQPEFFKALGTLIQSTDLQTLKDYITFHLVSGYAPYLSKNFSDEWFNFYMRNINGAEEQHPRWRRALDAEGGAIGEELGQIFVKEYFTPKAKARYEQMVENVRNAYKARMEKLDWMADSTKQKAIHKLMAVSKKVGYPEKWKDFSAMQINRGPYVLNMLRASEWWNNYQINKLGKPVNREDWDMTPQTYNAYYNESNNEIVLPAAMMSVPGYRDEELDDALVYGYTAASTIGHEITHGFDDQGRKSDEHGNLCKWWAPQDTIEFMKRADVLVQQFNKMNPLDTLHINGRATLGENLADLGGILIGLDAFKQTEAYKKGEKINGMTQLQRFFLGYSLGWLLEQRPERIATQLLTDVHSPAKYRVNGPLPNVPDFYEAFGIKPGDKMYIPDSLRVHLW